MKAIDVREVAVSNVTVPPIGPDKEGRAFKTWYPWLERFAGIILTVKSRVISICEDKSSPLPAELLTERPLSPADAVLPNAYCILGREGTKARERRGETWSKHPPKKIGSPSSIISISR